MELLNVILLLLMFGVAAGALGGGLLAIILVKEIRRVEDRIEKENLK